MATLFWDKDGLADTHCHLNEAVFDADRDAVVARAKTAGLQAILDVGVDLESSKKAIENAKKYPGFVFAGVGMHPEIFVPGSDMFGISQASSYWDLLDFVLDNIEYIAAIGEIGMDNFWLAKKVKAGEVSVQDSEDILYRQRGHLYMCINLAHEMGLPVSIHSRGAELDCFETVKNFTPRVEAVFHSFTGSYELAKQILDAGFYLGLNAIVTYNNASDLRTTFQKLIGKLSPDWGVGDLYKKGIYLETDAPFLSPLSRRGERNEPANVAEVWKWLQKSFR